MTAASRPSLDYRRVAALLVLAVLVLGPALWIVQNIRAMAFTDAQISAKVNQLHELDRRFEAAWSGGGAAGFGGEAAEGLYFEGSTAAVAGAQMQQLASRVVEAAGGRIIEYQILPATEHDVSEGRIELRLSFVGPIGVIQEVLYTLETGLPLILVRSLTVRPDSMAREDLRNPPLRAGLVLLGYREQSDA